MEVILKTLHYFSILFAGGVTVGSGVIQAAYMKAVSYTHLTLPTNLCV